MATKITVSALRKIIAEEIENAGARPAPQGWDLLTGPALQKFLRVFAERFSGHENPRVYAQKFGRKTVFASDSGVMLESRLPVHRTAAGLDVPQGATGRSRGIERLVARPPR